MNLISKEHQLKERFHSERKCRNSHRMQKNENLLVLEKLLVSTVITRQTFLNVSQMYIFEQKRYLFVVAFIVSRQINFFLEVIQSLFIV